MFYQETRVLALSLPTPFEGGWSGGRAGRMVVPVCFGYETSERALVKCEFRAKGLSNKHVFAYLPIGGMAGLGEKTARHQFSGRLRSPGS